MSAVSWAGLSWAYLAASSVNVVISSLYTLQENVKILFLCWVAVCDLICIGGILTDNSDWLKDSADSVYRLIVDNLGVEFCLAANGLIRPTITTDTGGRRRGRGGGWWGRGDGGHGGQARPLGQVQAAAGLLVLRARAEAGRRGRGAAADHRHRAQRHRHRWPRAVEFINLSIILLLQKYKRLDIHIRIHHQLWDIRDAVKMLGNVWHLVVILLMRVLCFRKCSI